MEKNKNSNVENVWKTAVNGEPVNIPMNDPIAFPDNHLMNAYHWAEKRYLYATKEAYRFNDKQIALYKKLRELEQEAQNRNMELLSVLASNPNSDDARLLYRDRHCQLLADND
jgi:hypothetical protein